MHCFVQGPIPQVGQKKGLHDCFCRACQFHPISLDHSNTFKCCGYNTYNPPSENNYCREGYHMSDVQQDLNLLEKIIRMDI